MERRGFIAAGAVLLVLGGVGGWLIGRGGEEGSDPGAYVTPGTDTLTERQVEMMSIVDQYLTAWQSTDGDGVASFMTDDGFIEYREQGWVFSVADRSLQDRIANGPYDTLRTVDPKLVYVDRIVLSGRIESLDLTWLSVVHFTSSGNVKIVSETIYL
jgi:hypothetical protein